MTWQTCSCERIQSSVNAPLIRHTCILKPGSHGNSPTFHLSGLGVFSHDKWLAMINGDNRIRAITCYCAVWMPSSFSLCLSLLFSLLNCTSHYPLSHILCFLFVYLRLVTPFVLSHHLPLPLGTSACILYSSLISSFIFLHSLSAAMLWWCSDLQPSLDRVRSASTTCLRPDCHFHSPDRDRYKNKILIAVVFF